MMIERNFTCNSVAAEFLADHTNKIQLLFGPVGCGKSSTVMLKLYTDAIENVMPGHDGIRRCKTLITRNTYSQLQTTTIKTWQFWFPPQVFGEIKGDSPQIQSIKQDGIEWEIIFLAVDTEANLERLKSLEVTNAYINEAQFIGDKLIIQQVLERTDRYPQKEFGGGLGGPRLYMDCNPPSSRHWIFENFEVVRPAGNKIYHYAPALIQIDEPTPGSVIDREGGVWVNNPTCDYRQQQRNPNYWLNLAEGASPEYIKVDLCGQYGVLTEGRAVHSEYNDTLHCSAKIEYNPLVELGLGWDFGLTPACAVVQLNPVGQLVVLAEFWTERDDLRGFAKNTVIPGLDKKFPGWRTNYASMHDPADAQGNEGHTNQQILKELEIDSLPADSNALAFRRDGLKYHLTRMPNGQPGFLLHSSCSMLREGLMGEFKYPLIKSTALTGSKQYQPKPKKNMHSHICEALEYIAGKYAYVTKLPVHAEQDKPYQFSNASFWGM